MPSDPSAARVDVLSRRKVIDGPAEILPLVLQADPILVGGGHRRYAAVGPAPLETAIERDHDERPARLEDEVQRLIRGGRVELVGRLREPEVAGVGQVDDRLVRRPALQRAGTTAR